MKCGTPTPTCVILADGTVDQSAAVKLATGLVCDRDHKLYITRNFYACCQPKNAIIVPDATTTLSPKDAELTDIVRRMKDVNAYLQDCIDKKNETCIMSAIARAAIVVTAGVEVMGLLPK